MKLKTKLGKGESVEQAEERLVKAIKRSKECTGHERYKSEYLNELHTVVENLHEKLLSNLSEEVKAIIIRDVQTRSH